MGCLLEERWKFLDSTWLFSYTFKLLSNFIRSPSSHFFISYICYCSIVRLCKLRACSSLISIFFHHFSCHTLILSNELCFLNMKPNISLLCGVKKSFVSFSPKNHVQSISIMPRLTIGIHLISDIFYLAVLWHLTLTFCKSVIDNFSGLFVSYIIRGFYLFKSFFFKSKS